MTELIVIGYDTEARAEEARKELLAMAREYLVDVADAVVVTADESGQIRLNQMVNTWSIGAAGGAFWGLMVGMLFLNPLVGAAMGAGAGALSGAMTDYGIDDKFMKEVATVLTPGQAALFMMARQHAGDKVIDRLGKKGGHLIRTNLDATKEEALRVALAKARADAGLTSQSGAAA